MEKAQCRPADNRPAPLQRAYLAEGFTPAREVARPITGRLHCGVAAGVIEGATFEGRPADNRPAPWARAETWFVNVYVAELDS